MFADAEGPSDDLAVDAAVEPEAGPRPGREGRAEAPERDRGAVVSHDAGGLPAGERGMLGHLVEAAAIVEEIRALQLEPGILWPKDIAEDEMSRLDRQINGRELLCPFTAVRRGPEGRLEAVPYSRSEILGPRVRRLAGELRAAASGAQHRSLAKLLRSGADALESDRAFSWAGSERDWIALEGAWEVFVGPCDTSGSPRGIKALFGMIAGREDRAMTEIASTIEGSRAEVEEVLDSLAGVGKDAGPRPSPRPRAALRVVDVWTAAGACRPTWSLSSDPFLPSSVRGSGRRPGKKVLTVERPVAFGPAFESLAGALLDADARACADPSEVSLLALLREIARGLGAPGETEIATSTGRSTTIDVALKGHGPLLEELEAEAIGLWLLSKARCEGWIDVGDDRRRYASALVRLLDLLRGDRGGLGARAAAVQIGWYSDVGAVTLDPETGLFGIDFEKLPAAVKSLVEEVVSIRAAGDFGRASGLAKRYAFEEDGSIARARAAAARALGAPDSAIHPTEYVIHGIGKIGPGTEGNETGGER